jgi:hypothetical protein
MLKVEDGLEGSRQWQAENAAENDAYQLDILEACREAASELGSMQVFVKTLKGQTVTLNVDASDTTDKFKAQVFADPLVDAQIDVLAYKEINKCLERYAAIQQLCIWQGDAGTHEVIEKDNRFGDPDNMSCPVLLFERVGDVDAHLADSWHRGPCSDAEWVAVKQCAFEQLERSITQSGMRSAIPFHPDLDTEWREFYWDAMHQVFGYADEDDRQ